MGIPLTSAMCSEWSTQKLPTAEPAPYICLMDIQMSMNGVMLFLTASTSSAPPPPTTESLDARLNKVFTQQVPMDMPGDVLILSVNRVPNADGPPGNPTVHYLVRSAQDCEDQCTVVTGCQGWTYCPRPDGCGTGCLEYHNTTEPRK